MWNIVRMTRCIDRHKFKESMDEICKFQVRGDYEPVVIPEFEHATGRTVIRAGCKTSQMVHKTQHVVCDANGQGYGEGFGSGYGRGYQRSSVQGTAVGTKGTASTTTVGTKKEGYGRRVRPWVPRVRRRVR